MKQTVKPVREGFNFVKFTGGGNKRTMGAGLTLTRTCLRINEEGAIAVKGITTADILFDQSIPAIKIVTGNSYVIKPVKSDPNAVYIHSMPFAKLMPHGFYKLDGDVFIKDSNL